MITILGVGACGGDNGGSSTTGPTSAAAPPPSPPPSPTQGINVTGTYRGTFTTNTGLFAATYALTQTGSSVTGTITFGSRSGGSSSVAGTLSGATLTINSAGCPSTATVSSDSKTITVTGFTCPDGTTGTGVFTRV